MKKGTPKSPVEPEFRFPKRYRAVPREKRHLARPGETEPRNCKVRVSIYLDADVIHFFKQRAARPGALPYQTQINTALREKIEDAGDLSVLPPIDALVNDARFIDAVARRVSKRLA
jgi:uncharacterized protein (DUF4415 family)